MCRMFRFKLTTFCILTDGSYHYATSINTLVIEMVHTRYIYTVHDTCDAVPSGTDAVPTRY
jgi:hypothetical protein